MRSQCKVLRSGLLLIEESNTNVKLKRNEVKLMAEKAIKAETISRVEVRHGWWGIKGAPSPANHSLSSIFCPTRRLKSPKEVLSKVLYAALACAVAGQQEDGQWTVAISTSDKDHPTH